MESVRLRYSKCLQLIHLLTEVKFLVLNTVIDRTAGIL